MLGPGLRTNGKEAWFGWPTDAKMEQLREAWVDSSDEAERKTLSQDFQRRAFEFVPYVPLGQYVQATAWRTNVTGLVRGPVPVFWNVDKA